MIPSIHTFLEDTKLLEACGKIMKRLLPSSCRTSLQQEFSQLHNGQTYWWLQTAEAEGKRLDEGSSEAARNNAYRSLCLYAIRHFPEMLCQPLRKDPTAPKPPVPSPELIWWYKLTHFAVASGYTGIDQTYSNAEEADYRSIEAFIPQVRPAQLYPAEMKPMAQQLVDVLSTTRGDVMKDAEMKDLGNLQGIKCRPGIKYRCGVPFASAFRQDREVLFLTHIDLNSQQHQRDYMGSFDVQRDVFHSFFGESDAAQTYLQPDTGGGHHAHSYNTDDFNSTRPPEPNSMEDNPLVSDPNELVTQPDGGQSYPDRVSRTQAIEVFRQQRGSPPYRDLLVLVQESEEAFRVHDFRRDDMAALRGIVQDGVEYQVPDKNHVNRVRLTNPTDFAQESLILVAKHQYATGIRRAIEGGDQMDQGP